MNLKENNTKLFSLMQIGITIVSIFLGMYSNENLSYRLYNILFEYFPYQQILNIISQGVVLIVMTFFFVLIGEIIPKKIGYNHPEFIAVHLILIMHYFSIVIKPVNYIITISSELLLKILSLKNKNNVLTERELKQIIKSSADLGVINHDEKNLFNKVLEFGNLRVKNIFIYKNNVACIDILDDGDTVLNKIKKIKHNHYLVTKDNNIDNILGIIDLKDLALENMNDPKFDMQKFIKKPFVVYENFFTFKLLDIFRQHKVKIAIVVDEFGTYNGIVTMNDIVNSILISNQEQILEKIHKRTKNSWLIEGQIKMIDFAEYFKINLENLKVKDNEILTLAGYFLEQLTSAPQLGDKIKIANYQMEIIDMDGQRIDKILVHLLK